MTKQIYDTLILGGGPAGLSAAVYLGRFLRSVVVVDAGGGRSVGPQLNENYLGFPRGIKASRLRQLGQQQAERFGVTFVDGSITSICGDGGAFALEGSSGRWQGRTVIVATGVTDIWPAFNKAHSYIGKSLFWCITCDGFRTRGKRVLLIGADDEAAVTALQFLVYTHSLTFVVAGADGIRAISPARIVTMRENGIEVLEGCIDRVEGKGGAIRRVIVGDETCEPDLVFSLLGAVPNTQLAAQLGVLVDSTGYVQIDKEQRTNVQHVYAAGDVTGPYAHQVSSAVHAGAMAAQAANYDLYADFQRE